MMKWREAMAWGPNRIMAAVVIELVIISFLLDVGYWIARLF